MNTLFIDWCQSSFGTSSFYFISLWKQINDLKAAVEASPPSGEVLPADRLKLIHQGKELTQGDSTLSAYNIADNDLVIVMLTRHKPPAPSQSNPAPAPPPPSLPPSQPPSNPHVEQLKEMGFPESQVTAALRAAQNDADLAVEFLFSGNIPSSPAPLSALESAVGVERDAERAAEEETGAGTNATVVAQLLSHPEMERIRRVVRENPSGMESMVAALAVTHPDLVRIINEDPASFWAALEENEEGMEEDEGEEEEEAGVLGALELSEADEAAIARLMEMGFGREQVVEAYILSGKEENAAVNFLLGG
ncbi:hypothetical protein NSK_005229 [Nannochloropsis salina CCMP1776]|uniref:UV excision repair protein RAD23 n=1 Tax=Nannochloropsis salina CCMP1776 TaxID=1027361 RepID=A0A4D9CW99_9STRA|nr:hypothetical protein NSK_005229 [Nannochloropsis salina CCMP1776]|eukprot:TFJ83460.1 hypothetical protein NSK_005229 [Nannochloropsis salina CCMP1776]